MNPIRSRATLVVAGALSITTGAPALAQTPAPAAPAAGGGTAETTPGAASERRRGSFAVNSVRRQVTLGNRALVTGVLRPARGGRRVTLQVRSGNRWRTMSRDVTDRRGAYRLRFTPARPAALPARLVFGGDRDARSAARRLGTINVYRRALASWYGPGLYGGHLACGGRLSPGTLGVAHKSLPCGTKVTFRHRGRSVRVPVVDRGPFVGAREFDLTSATKARLRFSGTGSVLTTR